MAEIQESCDGRDGRRLSAEELSCPKCGYAIEFFSDEIARHCPSCGFKHFRGGSSDCAQAVHDSL